MRRKHRSTYCLSIATPDKDDRCLLALGNGEIVRRLLRNIYTKKM